MFNQRIDRGSRRGRPVQRGTILLVILPVVTLGLAACSSSDSAGETSSTPPATTEVTPLATTLATTPETAPAITVATTSPTTVATTTVPSTTSPATTTTEPLPPALPRGEALTAGTTYRIGRAAIGRSAQFTNSVDGTRGQSGTGGFVLTADELGFEPMIGAFDLAKARYFIDPLVDAYTMLDEQLTAATTEPASDFLAYFAALPGIVAGEVTDGEFSGHPARMMSWTFGEFEGGVPCGPGGNCVNAMWFPGWISTYVAGDAGTTYVLDIDGDVLVVEVQNRPGAQEAAGTLVIGD